MGMGHGGWDMDRRDREVDKRLPEPRERARRAGGGSGLCGAAKEPLRSAGRSGVVADPQRNQEFFEQDSRHPACNPAEEVYTGTLARRFYCLESKEEGNDRGPGMSTRIRAAWSPNAATITIGTLAKGVMMNQRHRPSVRCTRRSFVQSAAALASAAVRRMLCTFGLKPSQMSLPPITA